MITRCGAAAAGLLLLLQGACGVTVRGFDQAAPVVPPNPLLDDLVVENVWQFDTTNFAEAVVHIAWVPGSEQVVTVHKNGLLRLYASIDAAVDDYVEVLNIMEDVDSEGDHGLLGFAFHPTFGQAGGVNTAFVMYSGNPKDVTQLPNNEAVTPLRPPEWGTTATGGYEWPDDLCTNLGDNNYGGKVCEKVYYIDRLLVDLAGAAPTMTKDITIFNGACGTSSTHGPGTLLVVGEDLVFSMGDGAQYDTVNGSIIDPGFPEVDGCYDPALGLDQGQFRAQRLEFPNGKVMKLTGDLLDTKVALTVADVQILTKGNRQPYRIHYQAAQDKLYIGDVGQGDGGTTERIFVAPGLSERTAAMQPFNWGWPCIEGVYASAEAKVTTPDTYALYDSLSEQARQQFMADNNLGTCEPVYQAVTAITTGAPLPATADPEFQLPIYEYRGGVLDPENPDLCTSDMNAAITAVHVYDGDALPAALQGKLIFADHPKQCLFFFDADADGNPDTTKAPHVLSANMDIVDLQMGPDGALYTIDYGNMRVSRMYGSGLGPAAGVVTEIPTVAPTPAPFAEPTDVLEAQTCFGGANMPELAWTRNLDGSYEADLVLGAVTIETSGGVTRTRAYNGLIPGPLIRMKACGIYHLNLYNDQAAWPTGLAGGAAVNGYHDPTETNLHLHGLHISGEAPGDDVFTVVEAGGMNTYIYVIPCDHSGGTYWYHPHKHGASALQTNGGAAGMLLIESNAREASDMPADIQSMPEQHLVIQEIDPPDMKTYALASGDRLFETTVLNSFVLGNGCEAGAQLTVEAGQWTRLHVLNVGIVFNSILTVVNDGNVAAQQCELGLMAKDGVWLAAVPRAVANNAMFLSTSSRLDVAIRCPVAKTTHTLTYKHVNDANAPEAALTVGTITVAASVRPAAADLTPWAPCRPVYLTDVATLAPTAFGTAFALEARSGAFNQDPYAGPDHNITTVNLDQPVVWSVTGSDEHPVHVHVNHMQLAATLNAEGNNWAELPGWNVAGDWVDTISAPGALPVYIRPERFTGHMLLHCHIAAHADMGLVAVANIAGPAGDVPTALALPTVTDYGTCAAVLPASTPYNKVAAVVPGIIQAEEFDLGGEGIAYHNVNLDRGLPWSALRATEAVEIDTDGKVSWVSYIRTGEWLKYSIDVAAAGAYEISLNIAALTPPAGLEFNIWLDAADGCPALASKTGLLAAVNDAKYVGTGSYVKYMPYVVPAPVALTAGEHTITLCFEGADPGINLDSIIIAVAA